MFVNERGEFNNNIFMSGFSGSFWYAEGFPSCLSLSASAMYHARFITVIPRFLSAGLIIISLRFQLFSDLEK